MFIQRSPYGDWIYPSRKGDIEAPIDLFLHDLNLNIISIGIDLPALGERFFVFNSYDKPTLEALVQRLTIITPAVTGSSVHDVMNLAYISQAVVYHYRELAMRYVDALIEALFSTIVRVFDIARFLLWRQLGLPVMAGRLASRTCAHEVVSSGETSQLGLSFEMPAFFVIVSPQQDIWVMLSARAISPPSW